MKEKILNFVGRYFSVIIVLAVLAGFLIAFGIGRTDFAFRGLSIAIPSIFAAIFILALYKENSNLLDIHTKFYLNQRNLVYLFIITYSLSVIILALSTKRPWYYTLTILLMYILIFIQIFSEKVNSNIILSELFFCTLNLIYGITLKYPLYFAGTDTLVHIFYSEVTSYSGQIIPLDLSIHYSYFPLYHILNAIASCLLNLDIKTTLFLITAPIYSITIIFIFFLFMRTTNNQRLSLLCCTLYSVNSTVLYYGSYMITRSMAFVGFLIILYLIYMNNSRIQFKILSIIFAIFIVLVHQVSMPQIILLLTILFTCEWIVNAKRYLHTNFFWLLNVLFLAYWFKFAYLFTKNVLSSYLQSEILDNPTILSNVISGNEWIFIINNIEMSIFLFFALVGIGYILRKEKSRYIAVFCLFSLATIILYIPTPLQTLQQTMSVFRFERFMLLISPFMAFSMAIGIYIFYNYMTKKDSTKCFSILIILLLFSTYVISSLDYIPLSNDFQSKESRRYFLDSELQGFNFVFKHISFGSELCSDYFTKRYFCQTKFSISEDLRIPYYTSNVIFNAETASKYKGYILIRDEQFTELGLSLGTSSNTYLFQPTIRNNLQLFKSLQNKNKLYSSPALSIYKQTSF